MDNKGTELREAFAQNKQILQLLEPYEELRARSQLPSEQGAESLAESLAESQPQQAVEAQQPCSVQAQLSAATATAKSASGKEARSSGSQAKGQALFEEESVDIPILTGWGFKHGDWILTCRKRFFAIDLAQGRFVRYKNEQDLNAIEDFPLREIHTIQTIERSWYMNSELTYMEFFTAQGKHQIGFKLREVCTFWVLFLKACVKVARNSEQVATSQQVLCVDDDPACKMFLG